MTDKKMPPLKKTIIIKNEDQKNVDQQEKDTQLFTLDCNICGQSHITHECPFLLDLHYIKDTPIQSRARQSLPDNLEITKMADGTLSIIAKSEFNRGTTFGPFQAKKNWSLNPMNNFPLKIFGNSSIDTYYLDYSDEDLSNWMCFILPASNSKEQNLICYQIKQDIYYTVIRTIPIKEELRVWYAPYYALKMKMPLYNIDIININDNLLNSDNDDNDFETTNLNNDNDDNNKEEIEILNINMAQELAEKLPAQHLGAKMDKKNWTCRICLLTINSVVNYAKHLMEHYKPLVGLFCNICNKKFNNNSLLDKHKLIKHSDIINNDTIGIPTSSNQQQHNIQTILNMNDLDGQQTSDVMKDILDKLKFGKIINDQNLILNDKENQSLELSLIDTNINDYLQNSLNINSITDSILIDNITNNDNNKYDDLNNELSLVINNDNNDNNDNNKKQINYDCDICEKKFLRPDYLYRHLRKHTGEFICSLCLSVFARKENLLSHLCLSKKKSKILNYDCPYCNKNFTVKKYLKRHMIKHFNLNCCKWCKLIFNSSTELELHHCNAPKHICNQCGKIFLHRAHLNRHMKLHLNPKPFKNKTKKFRNNNNNNNKKTTETTIETMPKTITIPSTIETMIETIPKTIETMVETMPKTIETMIETISIPKTIGTIIETIPKTIETMPKTIETMPQTIKTMIETTKIIPKTIKTIISSETIKTTTKTSETTTTATICEKCGDCFKTINSFKQHLKSHGERNYECDICKRRFHRIGVLKEHKQIHEIPKIPCNICGKKLKSKKALNVHILLHGNKKFQCEKCDKSFFQRCNYLKHYKQIHAEKIMIKCPNCPIQFFNELSFNKHLKNHIKPSKFICTTCNKSFHGQYQLKRHIQTIHSGIVYRCPYCKMTARHRHSMRRHFERQHKNLIDDWNKDGFVNQLIEKLSTNNDNDNDKIVNNDDKILLTVNQTFDDVTTQVINSNNNQLLNNSEIILETNQINDERNIENSELPLNQVPQLSIVDTDSELTESVLGNAYIFGEDGDIMFYVLDNNPVITEY